MDFFSCLINLDRIDNAARTTYYCWRRPSAWHQCCWDCPACRGPFPITLPTRFLNRYNFLYRSTHLLSSLAPTFFLIVFAIRLEKVPYQPWACCSTLDSLSSSSCWPHFWAWNHHFWYWACLRSDQTTCQPTYGTSSFSSCQKCSHPCPSFYPWPRPWAFATA